ncbi:MAG: sigma-70 family RNA polymerase sigma factor [Verrucomicrobia bacterium]|nr:sigma-70 family RNA polymerase sigma factor [Verrucomicrobiota bacterium]NBR46115.1 sigma-70 family RNA polymerase sigma factor [Verrucomicrobiota bacterium]NBU68516.1 sigma-70 family RNA polymerase sigma factor [Verrucomicrobiota bacterium]NDC00743.1 sigma-70 family RNA polymerase sigma factor [Verrucomicrobiota bacterium]NDF17364.1 sigma-70 family RNA polymerase sigma factor [Verrucomicrobiota bacterium]
MPVEESDDELMVRIREGEEEAFRVLVERHQDRVYGTVARMMGRAGADTEEVAQDVFLRVWKSAGSYRPEGKFTVWLMTILRNLVFTQTARRNRRREVEAEDPCNPETGETFTERQADENHRSPPENLIFRELEQSVEEALRALPESQRLVLHLRHTEGLEFEEIMKIMGMSLPAVKSLIFRARESLREKLSGYLSESK